ncbi:RecQ family ATP-dependent DNA helicase [Treponema sp.]|uniref:RecQ family ATP-dependent DNA helicase n=1 Tax=Treponema sp. TaxID=166 RepID=UPI00298E00E7|nr:RecQ family ATP-dependent DNA helicase [Treponema sp.]MCR5612856.1 RecQ family ATP-dependent DNA helicase [Treponema sp.]
METYSKTKDEVDEFNASHIFVDDDPALLAAKKAFHVEYLFPWQRLVISNIMDSFRDQNSIEVKLLKKKAEREKAQNEKDYSDAFCLGRQIVLLPTGAGKSMCFLVPSIMLPGPTLIIYPLLGLMADQERRMKEGQIESVTFRGGQSIQEREENFKKLDNGAKIIIANPEVLQSNKLLERLKKYSISHIAIDEAHCTSEWGDSFRPAYLGLGEVIKKLDVKIVTAFTATASPSVLSRIAEVLFDGDAHIVRSESDRPNIHYYVQYAYSKVKALYKLCMTEQRPILVFCGTRHNAEETARELSEFFPNEQVKFYHAGLSRKEKTAVEKWYFPKKDAILCSTCAFGMGIDKPDIRTVIHTSPSMTAESFVQEAGRGGRDRQIAKSILLWNYNDHAQFEQFPASARERAILRFAESKTCRRQVLLDALGGEQAVCEGCDICLSRRAHLAHLAEPAKLAHILPDPHKTLLFWRAQKTNAAMDYKATPDSSSVPDYKTAPDAQLALSFIRKNQKVYTRGALVPLIKNRFNERDRAIFGINVWTENDVKEIVLQLEAEGRIKNCAFPWKNKVRAVK